MTCTNTPGPIEIFRNKIFAKNQMLTSARFLKISTNKGGYECAVADLAALADGNARDIWDWYFQLADRMSNETTNGGQSWPADQMNLTHYLDGRLVPTAAPVDGSASFDALGGSQAGFQRFFA